MKSKENIKKLTIGAIGVVFGDIGTSPLYALKGCFVLGNLTANEATVLGLVSLFIWSLFLVTSVKYIGLVLKVHNQGEGGILVLSALCAKILPSYKKWIPILLGIAGTALFFGDGVITPAISVISALEGIQVIMPFSTNHLMLASIVVLLFLFILQKRGSGIIGAYFGPIMLIWFIVIGAMGIHQIIHNPIVLKALMPSYVFHFFWNHGFLSFAVLGASILVLTGAEALYADMGHFGKRAIQNSWNFLVFPCLVLNYLGQGALVMKHPETISNIFYNMVPLHYVTPLILLSTVATVIASQSIISGIFSVTWQAIMLNYLPRMRVVHTSSFKGQVYVPLVNWILCVLSIGVVVKFQSSENIITAYGLSVACVMAITTCLVFMVAYKEWQWPNWKLLTIFVPFMTLDLIFVGANSIKFFEGAWYTGLIAAFVGYIIYVWRAGNKVVDEQKFPHHKNIKTYLENYSKKYTPRIPGCAIFLARTAGEVPDTLMLHLHHNKFLHKKLIFLSICTEESPRIAYEKKFEAQEILKNMFILKAHFGFQEVPNIHKIVTWAQENNILTEKETISCFLSKGIAVASQKRALSKFNEKVYIFLSKNALAAYEFFKIPHDEVVEMGIRYKV